MESDQKPPLCRTVPPLMPRVPTTIMMKDTQPTSLRLEPFSNVIGIH